MLHKRGVPMEAKPFAVGVRIEHRQADCDAAQYRQYAGHPGLPASTYKLSCHLPGGRAAYSFCVCPGGEVVAAASEAERVVTNGMSEFARDKENINGGLLVNVTPEDYGGAEDPLAGIAFQRKLESAAYALGGGDYRAPAQRVGDFLAGRPSVGPGRVHPSYRPGVTWTDLRRCLPPFVADTIAGALPLLGQKLRGYDDPGRRPDGGGEPFLLPCAHPTGWDLPVLSPGPVPLRRGSRLCRRHPLRRRGWDALCRATLSIHSKGV